MKFLQKRKLGTLFQNIEGEMPSAYLKTVFFITLGIVGLMVLTAAIAFSILVQGAEQNMVPDVTGMKLENALIALQEKDLNARIQLHYSSNPEDKGTILNQDPHPGALVKAGKKITLKVSRGAILDKVENYIGWKLTELQVHLQTVFTTYGPLLKIEQPVQKVFDEAPADTILEQKPAPDTPISGVTYLSLVVSKGSQEEYITIEKYVGMNFQQALAQLTARNIPFTFISRTAEGNEEPGTVVAQSPSEESSVQKGTYVQLTMAKPENIPKGYAFGILKKTLPNYPVAVDMKLQAVTLQGEKKTIFSMKHPGGVIAIPYLEEENTLLILSVFDEEIIRYTIRPIATE